MTIYMMYVIRVIVKNIGRFDTPVYILVRSTAGVMSIDAIYTEEPSFDTREYVGKRSTRRDK